LEHNAYLPYASVATGLMRPDWSKRHQINPPASKHVIDRLVASLTLPDSRGGYGTQRNVGMSVTNDRTSKGMLRAYDACGEIIRKHSKSFYLSVRFLPPAKRRAIIALYAFCRTSDDLVDTANIVNGSGSARGGINAAFDRWSALVSTSASGEAGSLPAASERRHPVATAWADTRARFGIPAHLADELLAGIKMDLTIDRYETWDELWIYCYKVASTVGLMSMYITGATSMDAIPCAVQLGVALQLTNILRDIGEDARAGRVYLPAEEMERFGYTEAMLFEGVVNRNFVSLMEFQMSRAEALYKEAMPGIAMLPRDSRLAVTAAATLYRSILGRIRAARYDVFTQRAHLSTRGKLCAVPGIWWSSRR
jgi:phytoene synthase